MVNYYSEIPLDLKNRQIHNDISAATNLPDLGGSVAELHVGREKITCSRFILCARSKVFCASFSHPETTEHKTGVVEIKNTSPKSVKDFVTFLYQDTVPDLNTSVRTLHIEK